MILYHLIIQASDRIARDIQKNLLPHSIPQYKKFDIAAFNMPSKQVGGDFYDIIPLDNSSFCIAIADVSGKGVPAALKGPELKCESLMEWLELEEKAALRRGGLVVARIAVGLVGFLAVGMLAFTTMLAFTAMRREWQVTVI